MKLIASCELRFKGLKINMESQDITHTPKDNPGITDCRKVVEIALALNDLIRLI